MDERTGIDMGASVAVLGPQIAGLPEVVDVTRLLAAEKAGKNRKRVLTCLEKRGRALCQLLASPKGAVDQHGQMVAALASCHETGRSARKAANLGVEGGLVTKGEKALWPDIKPGTLQGWLKNPALAEGGGHERQKILLLSELTDICEALVEGADRHKFKDRSQIRTMTKQALRLRQLQTKQKVRGRKNHHFRTTTSCWRAIGVGQNGFDFNLIDTEKLLDDATTGSNPAAASAAAAVASDNSSPETRSMVVVSEQVAEIVLPHLPVPSPPAKVRRTSAAYWQQKTTSAVEQRDEARLKVAQMEAAVLSAKGLGLYDDLDKGWQKPTASRKVLQCNLDKIRQSMASSVC